MKSGLFLKLFIFFCLISYCTPVVAAEKKYSVADIPRNMLTDAKAVVRKSETVFEITGINEAVQKVTYAITIMNSNGIDNSLFMEFYDKFLAIRKIQSQIYDQFGAKVKDPPNTEVQDYSAIAGFSLFEDNRVKFFDPKYRTTPFTIEYTYEIVYKGLLFYPAWKVYDEFNISVEKSSFVVIVPKGFKFRYLEKNISKKCEISEGKDKTTYSWDAENMPAIKIEPFGKPFHDYTPVVYTAPNDFEIGSYKGNLESWSNFGKWITMLGEGRNVLATETTENIKKLVSGLNNDYDKIKALYNFLQNKVRYVSIQIGIGGWQPIKAETVDRLSYGDCKALTNYMKSLLDVIGIKSYYTLVMAGENAPLIKADFPSNQFNHAILCVPVDNDTIWLECTSQRIPFGYLGTFTDDRNVLLIGDQGGIVVRTKSYPIDNNRQDRKAIVDLTATGNANATVNTIYSGVLYDDISTIFYLDETDRKKFIQKRITIPSFNLLGFNHTEVKEIIPSVREEITLSLPNYGTKIGKGILFSPNLMTRIDSIPYKTKERRSAISIRRPHIETDSIIFKLPLSFKIDQIPEKVSISTKFGEYSNEVKYINNELIYIRTFRLFKGDYPLTDYDQFMSFFEKILVSDESKIALLSTM